IHKKIFNWWLEFAAELCLKPVHTRNSARSFADAFRSTQGFLKARTSGGPSQELKRDLTSEAALKRKRDPQHCQRLEDTALRERACVNRVETEFLSESRDNLLRGRVIAAVEHDDRSTWELRVCHHVTANGIE